jgi:hypothetical protein
MIDIKELRSMVNGAQFESFANSAINSLLDRLEEAENERDNANSAAVGVALKAKMLEAELDILRAKVEERERQEPVGTLHDDGCFVWSTPRPYESNYAGWKMKLYLAPGAQPAPKKGAALAYTDPEASADENSLHIVSSLMAGRAYNSICKMIGGRWPDAKIQEEAPEAHDFFMAMFTGSPEESAVHPALPNRGDGAAGAGCPV